MMKNLIGVAALVLGTAFLTVSATRPASALAAPKKAECAVCREGEEPVRATAKHEGKEYYFCNAGCRDQFLKNPAAYLKAELPRLAPAFSLKDLNGGTVSLSDYK